MYEKTIDHFFFYTLDPIHFDNRWMHRNRLPIESITLRSKIDFEELLNSLIHTDLTISHQFDPQYDHEYISVENTHKFPVHNHPTF